MKQKLLLTVLCLGVLLSAASPALAQESLSSNTELQSSVSAPAPAVSAPAVQEEEAPAPAVSAPVVQEEEAPAAPAVSAPVVQEEEAPAAPAVSTSLAQAAVLAAPEGAQAQAVASQAEQFIERLYQLILNRSSDATGMATHLQSLKTAQSGAAGVVQGFFASDEMAKKNLSHEEFLKLAYAAIFNRSPDATGVATWLSALEDGCSRNYVLAGMTRSDEFKKMCDSFQVKTGEYKSEFWRDRNREVTAFVTRLYSICLGRKGEADGMENWTKHLLTQNKSGSEVAYGFFFSEEYSKKNYSKSEHIEFLYQAFLGRASDPAGKATWLGHYKDETLKTKEFLFYGFAQSKEFADICARYGIRPMPPAPAPAPAPEPAAPPADVGYAPIAPTPGYSPDQGGW